MTVTAPSAARSAPRARPVPAAELVDRDAERERLLAAVTRPPTVAVVHGEEGVGKSRLVREVAGGAATAGMRVLLGRCHPSSEPFPLGPVIEALGPAGGGVAPGREANPLLGALRPLLPEWARQLPPEPRRVDDPGATRHRTFRALRALLEGLGPTLCVLEDLQWADGETLEFLGFLVAAAPPTLDE